MSKSILIIDDSKFGREIIHSILHPGNYNILFASNGKEGITQAKKYIPDFIFLDNEIPELNGRDMYSVLKSFKETEDIPIVLMTSDDPQKLKQKLNTNGGVEIIKKPINQNELLTCFENFSSKIENSIEAGKDVNILVAEDDAVTRRMVEYLLKKNGYNNLRLAVDGKEVLEFFMEKTPELMILDYFMPHKTGFQVLQEIRRNPKYNHIPIIFLTAVDDKSKLIEALNSGATDFITKPFDRAELLARVHAHARNYYLQKKLRNTNTKLENLNNELRKKNDQIQDDLRSARKIQEALLPKELNKFKNLDVHFFYQASNSVGGDFINIFDIDERCAGFYIADVSGHGVTSALVTVFIREQINNILKKLQGKPFSPAEILRQLNNNFNKEVFFIQNGIYLTIFCGIIDLNKYSLLYASAGHHALPLIIDHQHNAVELSELGVAIGFLDDFEYKNHEIKLSKNQRIFLHTDGIIEMENSENELFGMDRLKNFLVENHNLIGEDLMISLVKKAITFSNDPIPQDDIALILLEVK